MIHKYAINNNNISVCIGISVENRRWWLCG